MQRQLTGVLLWVLVGCSTSEFHPWAGTMDTLPNGVVRVTNPRADARRGAPPPWHLVEEVRIGTATGGGPAAFASVVDLDVDALGRVYVLDRQTQDIRVFNQNGSFVRQIGRRGGGPGEFAAAGGMEFDPSGRLWVSDQGNARYSLFDTSGALVKEFPRHLTGPIRLDQWYGAFDRSGALHELALYFTGQGPQLSFAIYDTMTGRLVDTVSHVGFARAPFGRSVRLATMDGWWLGSSDAYRLYRTDFQGDTLLIVERDYDPIPLESGERDSVAKLRRSLNSLGGSGRSQIGDSRPIFVRFLEDDEQYLWVMLSPLPSATATEFDVFDAAGRYVWTVIAPVLLDRSVQPISRGRRIYGVARDGLDVPYVIIMSVQGR